MEPDYGRNTFDFRIRFRVDLETLYSNERELCDSDEPHLLGTQHSPLDAHLLHLWMGLSKRPSLVRTRDSLNHGIDSLLRLIRNSFREDLFQELRFRDPVQMRPDNKYPEERYKLLIHLFIKLLEVLIAWAQEREVVTEKLRDIEKYRYEDRVELTEEVLLDYCTGENWHFEEHIEKILLYSTVIVFLNEAAAPSVDERIYWYLFDE
ncbi:hypothetical protein BJ508DRAFT_332296 [Ascobolus immersus RN42]|uniref:Uncharacterized protein n=1 Tax=Ascobolus immersus RN42 TaxID=1160509 RepID=A0A3N4HN49_ASCIM|nr:hypothetical protein BJ508DRAFT_332296 [Ascobolus immersus RN42]